MSIDVYEDIDSSLSSQYSIHSYLGNSSWDYIKKKVQALTPAATHVMQVPGRLDIASQSVYSTPLLDWILLLYNGIDKIGYDQGIEESHSLSLTLPAVNTEGYTYVTEDPLKSGSTSVMYTDIDGKEKKATSYAVDTYRYTYGFGAGPAVLQIDFNPTDLPRLTNISGSSISFRVAYTDIKYSQELDSGTILQYPSLDEVKAVLQQSIIIEDKKNLSFGRL